MAVSTADYFSTRPSAASTARTRPSASVLGNAPSSPRTPRTPLLGRSISSQLGSPGSFRAEQEEFVVYELGARHLSAGFAGESRPRVVVKFTPDGGRRVGDYRQYEPAAASGRQRKVLTRKGWAEDHELYRVDIRSLDLGLVEDNFERAFRKIHTDHLQLDQKPRKAVLAVPSLLPTPILEIALKVLFNHHAQPPSVVMLTSPILACVGAGLRNAVVVDVGWEESVVTAVGEYKEICQRRSVRAGKTLTQNVAKMLNEEAMLDSSAEKVDIRLELAEEVTERMIWCRSRSQDSTPNVPDNGTVTVPMGGDHGAQRIAIPFHRFSDPAESTFFASPAQEVQDDHDLALHTLVYRVLLSLPHDLRAICISRIVLTGGLSHIPGLKRRLLQEVSHLVQTQGWDPVQSYGSVKERHSRALKERSANLQRIDKHPDASLEGVQFSPTKMPMQDHVQHGQRVHDDVRDPITLKAEREAQKRTVEIRSVVRGVETLGTWAGASLVASLRVKGVHEVEREEFPKHGMKDESVF